jgi:hypothetical protein
MIVNALQTWAKSAPNESIMGFIGTGQLLTPTEIVSAVKQETSDGKAILEILEHGLRREGMSKVLARLTRSLEIA